MGLFGRTVGVSVVRVFETAGGLDVWCRPLVEHSYRVALAKPVHRLNVCVNALTSFVDLVLADVKCGHLWLSGCTACFRGVKQT
jgi:hypothetical protein